MQWEPPSQQLVAWGGEKVDGTSCMRREDREALAQGQLSTTYQPMVCLGQAYSMFLASFLTLSSLSPQQKMTGKEKLDHLGLWEGLVEKELVSDNTWEAWLLVSKYFLKQHRQGPFMKVSIELQECAFGNFDRNMHFVGVKRFSLGGKVSPCALLSSSAHQMPTPGKFGIFSSDTPTS